MSVGAPTRVPPDPKVARPACGHLHTVTHHAGRRQIDHLRAGLSQAQARERLARDGPNELPVSRPRGVLRLLVLEPMFLLLVACGAIYMALGNRQEAFMLLGFVLVVMGISFVQQGRTERSLQALRDFSSPRALVVHEGQPLR